MAPIEWAYGNQGAANAWVVLVGPSPGEEKRTEFARYNSVGFGAKAQSIGMSGKRQRAWDALITAAFGREYSDQARDQLVALINLSSANETNESALSAQTLNEGVDEVWRKINLMHPRVVVTLSNAVFDRLSAKISVESMDLSDQPSGPHQKPLRVFSFTDVNTKARTLVIKPPQHPSRPLKRPAHLPKAMLSSELKTYGVRDTVNWFLDRYL